MRQLQPVIWSKGTFLQPQHLQTQDRYLEGALRFRLDALSFRPWGLRTLQVDQEALAGGTFALAEASGILPDGLLFDIPNADPGPDPKPLADCFEPDSDTLDVHLAIPSARERGLNVAGQGSVPADVRYRAEFALVRDENTGLAEKPVAVARKSFRLVAGEAGLEGCSALRVARVRRTAAGLLQLDPEFVPPLLDLTASPRLLTIGRRLVEILSAKSAQLAGSRRQRNLSLADFGTADIANFWLLYTVNAHFPLLQHAYEVRRGHPEGMYAEMLALAGSLTTFSPTLHPRDLPRYDHDDLGTCFRELDEKIRLLLETVIPSNFVSLPLKLVQPSIYATAIDDDRYLRNTRLYLAVTADANEGEVIGRTPGLVKLCSVGHIEHLVRNALPGVPLTHVPRPPSTIPVKLNWQYFSLNQGGAAWEAITRARNLAAYIPGELPNPQAELIVLLPEG